MIYNPALDGLRAVAVIIVVAFHTMVRTIPGGMYGVDIFFVLSGYLITTILRGELLSTGTIDRRRFYWRRTVRLMPALVLAMAGIWLAYALLLPGLDITADVLTGLLYVSNYGAAFWHVPDHIGHTWSLSVEAQFYLAWPLFLIATRRLTDRSLIALILALFVAATAWRCADGLIWNDWDRTYYRLDTRLSGLLLGATLALGRWQVEQRSAELAGVAALGMLVLLVFSMQWRAMPSLLLGGLAADLAAASLIVALSSGQPTFVSRVLSQPWLVRLGVLSYSIYLWHFGFAYALRDMIDPLPAFLFSLFPSIAIAALSHTFVEKPLMAWANRDGKGAMKPAPCPSTARSGRSNFSGSNS